MSELREPRSPRLALQLAVAAALLLFARVAPCTERAWNAPLPLFSIDKHVRGPTLLADSSGTVHLFFQIVRNPTGSLPDTLMYARRDARGWSTPIMLIGGDDSLAYPVVVIDARGFVHVVFSGRYGRLIYLRAHLSQLGEQKAWTDPETLSDGGVFSSALLTEGEQTLHLAYAARGTDVYYRRSDDGGRNWSDPVRVSNVGKSGQATDGPSIAQDGHGRLHAVWTQFRLPSGWPPMGAYYSRSLDGGATWSPPRQFSGEGYGAPAVIARGDGEVHVVWNALAVIGERVHQWSSDGGATWTDPQVITRRINGGWTGAPALSYDGGGRLHLITSVDGPNGVERIFHLVWDGTTWSEPEVLSDGTVAEDSVEWPTLTISDGNHLHVAYEVDYRGIWYADRVVDAPPVAARPVPTVPTGLWVSVQATSVPFRIFVIVIAALGCEAGGRSIWRAVRRGRG